MAKRIASSYGDNSHLRRHRVQKALERRRLAPVVGDLQRVARKLWAVPEERAFCVGLDVSCEKDAMPVGSHLQYQRCQVGVVASDLQVADARVEDLHIHALQ